MYIYNLKGFCSSLEVFVSVADGVVVYFMKSFPCQLEFEDLYQ